MVSTYPKRLALSGGGYRATLFHLGALWRLNEFGYLAKLASVDSVSGGSILAAYLGMKWSSLTFDGSGVASNFDKLIVSPVRKFCSISLDVPTLLRGILTPWKLRRPGNLLERAYRLKLYGDATLQDLPSTPAFVIHSTDLIDAKPFSFSRSEAGRFLDVTIEDPQIRLSQCVAASSAFPPVFSPYKLVVSKAQGRILQYRRDHGLNLTQRVALGPKELTAHTFYLSDAGIISNLAIGKGNYDAEEFLVSDAGGSLSSVSKGWFQTTWISLAIRAALIAASQSDPLRVENLRYSKRGGKNRGAYWSIRQNLIYESAPNELHCTYEKRVKLASHRTRLNSFSEEEQSQLINLGYANCDLSLRVSIPGSYDATRPTWPCPGYPLHS